MNLKNVRRMGLIFGLAVLGCLASVKWGLTAYPDAEIDLGFLRIVNGSVTWKIGNNGNSNLVFLDTAGTGAAGMTLFPSNGGLGLRNRTTTQFLSDVPGQVGALGFNTTSNKIMFATGTTAGQWSAY